MKYPYPSKRRSCFRQLICPVCRSGLVFNRRGDHYEFAFTHKGHELTCNIQRRHCEKCKATWSTELSPWQIDWAIYKYFSTLVIDEDWKVAATQAAKDGEACSVPTVISLMKDMIIPINEMETWTKWSRNEYPAFTRTPVERKALS